MTGKGGAFARGRGGKRKKKAGKAMTPWGRQHIFRGGGQKGGNFKNLKEKGPKGLQPFFAWVGQPGEKRSGTDGSSGRGRF